jgi:hypothetical protein
VSCSLTVKCFSSTKFLLISPLKICFSWSWIMPKHVVKVWNFYRVITKNIIGLIWRYILNFPEKLQKIISLFQSTFKRKLDKHSFHSPNTFRIRCKLWNYRHLKKCLFSDTCLRYNFFEWFIIIYYVSQIQILRKNITKSFGLGSQFEEISRFLF